MTTFTHNEIQFLESIPEALRLVADYHDFQEILADAMGVNCPIHKTRRIELNTEAEILESNAQE